MADMFSSQPAPVVQQAPADPGNSDALAQERDRQARIAVAEQSARGRSSTLKAGTRIALERRQALNEAGGGEKLGARNALGLNVA